jgi:hypothetical protein
MQFTGVMENALKFQRENVPNPIHIYSQTVTFKEMAPKYF